MNGSFLPCLLMHLAKKPSFCTNLKEGHYSTETGEKYWCYLLYWQKFAPT